MSKLSIIKMNYYYNCDDDDDTTYNSHVWAVVDFTY